ncbi:MAG: SMC-Scp complex subunit ScpB [Candidatus Omnitrophica bacterium]|jgi:segregation and condensation protein B|nr:SMC-Scp complex subunit ScpB [Candidatus Omnitrophota bacterium]
MSENNIKPAIEALLFSSEKPLALEQLRQALDNLEAGEVHRVMEELRAEYVGNGRGLRIVEVAGGFQMVSSPDFAGFLKKLHKDRRPEKLSKQALETLAIIAYKQPVSKFEIESLRSVNIDGVIKSLLDKDVIRIAGRKKAPGRPFVFGTTKKFLEHFGLKSLDELPKMEDFVKKEQANEPQDAAQQS